MHATLKCNSGFDLAKGVRTLIRVCEACSGQGKCTICGRSVSQFDHVGVRASSGNKLHSGIWHIALPCGHAQKPAVKAAQRKQLAVYNGGPLWKGGFRWQSIYWGTYWQGKNLPFGPAQVDKAVADIDADLSFWGGLSEYNVGKGTVNPSVILGAVPPASIDDSKIGPQIKAWIKARLIPELGQQGAYNLFFPPGVSITLQGSASCQAFCDYHQFDGTHFYTVEPYPCSRGCNQCTTNGFDTLTQGLSEEMVELATDMEPGTGWVIGQEELCDYCDSSFVCHQISTGEYVNAWYSNAGARCWAP